MSKSEHNVEILKIWNVTHNVKSFRVQKPDEYDFEPGQATEVSINKSGWKEEKRPFTFTSLNTEPYLEFTIKIYHDHQGVTNEMDKLKEGDQLLISDVWGAIKYKGPGYFIAGGAGITPFIAILRQLKSNDNLDDHYLIFSNLTEKDIILKDEFKEMLGDRFINTLTEEKSSKYYNKFINKEFLDEMIADFSQHFYVCGPKKMVEDISNNLESLGASADSVIFEK
jgi:ferredoxin-NADP reductase